MSDETHYFTVFFMGVFGGVISTIAIQNMIPAYKGFSKMSRRKIKRKIQKEIDWVQICVEGRSARIPRADVSLFIAENMECLAEIFDLEMPPQCTSSDKYAKVEDLTKIADFMMKLQKLCYEKNVICDIEKGDYCHRWGGNDET